MDPLFYATFLMDGVVDSANASIPFPAMYAALHRGGVNMTYPSHTTSSQGSVRVGMPSLLPGLGTTAAEIQVR